MFPVYSDKVCVITPKALKVPQWMAIFKCFSLNLWFLIVLINTLCGYVWYLLKSCAHYADKFSRNIKSSKNRTSRELDRFSVISIEMWIIMLGGASIRLPHRSMERLFLCVCLVSNIVIAGSFQVTIDYNTPFQLTFVVSTIAYQPGIPFYRIQSNHIF